MDLIIVVGLGNPGTEYDGTRHNVGFEVIDELAWRFKATMRSGQGDYLMASHREEGKCLILVKPMTYMNNSGSAVKEVLERYEAAMSQPIVIADDIALPLGRIRVRAKGSDGGHNGLHSVVYQLNSDEFARIRCGICPEVRPPKGQMADFVLSHFERKERATVNEMVSRSADAVVEYATAGIGKVMNKFKYPIVVESH